MKRRPPKGWPRLQTTQCNPARRTDGLTAIARMAAVVEVR
jgi:hypothetical protein